MTEEKPLEKHTVKELKEIARGIEGIHGVSAMKKEELIDAIRAAKGIPLKAVREKSVTGLIDVKRNIKLLKQEMADIREKGDRIVARQIRKKIGKLKKRTRGM
jgi:hypothetical protein